MVIPLNDLINKHSGFILGFAKIAILYFSHFFQLFFFTWSLWWHQRQSWFIFIAVTLNGQLQLASSVSPLWLTEILNFCETNLVYTLLISCINGSPGPLQAGRFSFSKTRLLGIIPRCLYYKNATPGHYRGHFCFVPFYASWRRYYAVLSPVSNSVCTAISSCRLGHLSSYLSKPSHVNLELVAVIVISSNTCCVWTTHICMDYVLSSFEAHRANTLSGCFYFVRALLSGDFCGLVWGLVASIR